MIINSCVNEESVICFSEKVNINGVLTRLYINEYMCIDVKTEFIYKCHRLTH